MFHKNIFFCLAAGLIFSLGCSREERIPPVSQATAVDFIIAGSGQNVPLTTKLVEHYNKKYGNEIKLPSSIGTSGAITAVKAGAIELGLSARPLTEAEKREGFQEIPYARVGIIIGANADVPDENITYSDLVSIFESKRINWENGKRIIVQSREIGSGINNILIRKVPGFKEALTNSQRDNLWTVYFTDQEETQAIMSKSGALGFTNTAALKAQNLLIKSLKVNGVEPTINNIKNGSYQLYNDLHFVYKGEITDRASNFLDFVFSADGQKVLTDNGSIPLKGK